MSMDANTIMYIEIRIRWAQGNPKNGANVCEGITVIGILAVCLRWRGFVEQESFDLDVEELWVGAGVLYLLPEYVSRAENGAELAQNRVSGSGMVGGVTEVGVSDTRIFLRSALGAHAPVIFIARQHTAADARY